MNGEEDTLRRLCADVRARLEWEREQGVQAIPCKTRRSSRAAAREGVGKASTSTGSAEGAPRPTALPVAERRRMLAAAAEEVAGCRRCRLADSRSRTVFGVGSPEARLCFVGEGPGFEEDRQGEPFVGRAGQLLNRMIAAMGLERRDVYICNTVKCRPPENRTPLPDEMEACAPYLEAQIEVVAPEVLVALGRPAAMRLLETAEPMGRLRGRFHEYRGTPVMPTYHPAYLLRNPSAKRVVWEDLQQVMKRLGLSGGGA